MPAYSGLWDKQGWGSYALTGSRSRLKRMIARVNETHAGRATQAIMTALNGTAAGGTASASYKRVGHASTPLAVAALGGVRTIDTVTVINRVTTAADESDVDLIINDKFAPSSYPADRSGRGVGGMAGKF